MLTCQAHGAAGFTNLLMTTENGNIVQKPPLAHGAAGFTNLLITTENGDFVLNPHLANCCTAVAGPRRPRGIVV